MSRPDISGEVRRSLSELTRIRDRVLPVKVGRAVVESVRDNFRKGGFYGRKWEEPLRRRVGFRGADGLYGPLLSRQNALMNNTDYTPGNGRVIIRNTADYARIHNEGGDIAVTQRMKRFFWYKNTDLRKRGLGDTSEAEFWKKMALKRAGSRIRIPCRQFIGDDMRLTARIKQIVDSELQNYIKYGIHSRRTR